MSVNVLGPDAVFKQVDTDGSGTISFPEFIAWWTERHLATTGVSPDEALLATVRQQWQAHDLDADGQLDAQEFATVLADVAFGDWRFAHRDCHRCPLPQRAHERGVCLPA